MTKEEYRIKQEYLHEEFSDLVKRRNHILKKLKPSLCVIEEMQEISERITRNIEHQEKLIKEHIKCFQ